MSRRKCKRGSEDVDPEWKGEQCSGEVAGGLTVGTALLGEEYLGRVWVVGTEEGVQGLARGRDKTVEGMQGQNDL